MATKIQLRRDTAANWQGTNPVLAQGEPGVELDTKKMKVGDGSTAWNSLAYVSTESGQNATKNMFVKLNAENNDNWYNWSGVVSVSEDGLNWTPDIYNMENTSGDGFDIRGHAVGGGRVVVTDLHNYATPLIRYVTGDYAIRGNRCSCGRGLGTLQKIQGRERNLIVRADGSRYWPQVGMYQFDKLDFVIRRYQVIQHDAENIEYKIMIDAPLTPEQESKFLNIVQTALGSEFKISINVVNDFPYAKNGKFEEFICKIQ